MSNDATFNFNITNIITSAKIKSAWILRTFKTREKIPMLTLWKSLVLPTLEYCSQLWSPLRIGNIQRIEVLQWSFIRKIKISTKLNYWETLSNLKLYSLQRRRERYRIIYVWKILENLVPNSSDCSDQKIQAKISPRNGRRCIIKVTNTIPPQRIQTLINSSFSHNAPTLFNSLPKFLRNLTGCSLDFFKSTLDRFLIKTPDEPLIPGYTANRRAESNSLVHMIQFTE